MCTRSNREPQPSPRHFWVVAQNETVLKQWKEAGGSVLVPQLVELTECDLTIWPYFTFDELLGQYRKVTPHPTPAGASTPSAPPSLHTGVTFIRPH